MSSQKKVFIIGPGFIGWNVLDVLAEEGYKITGYVRREEHAKQIKATGASEVVLGDLHDKPLITQHTAAHDIVIHTATADDLPSVEAVLDGLAQRAAQGLRTIYIHTSGAAVLDDGSAGAYRGAKIYHDDRRQEIDAVPDAAPHRHVDLAILKAREKLGDAAHIAIIIPPLVHGLNPRHRRLSIQIPTLARYALKHGFAGHVGAGRSAMGNVHVRDLARGYAVLLHRLESAALAPDADDPEVRDGGGNPYYFCEATGDAEPSWREVAAVVGAALHRAGRLAADPQPRPLPPDTYPDLFGAFTPAVLGLNSRSRAVRLRALGWAPEHKDWQTSFVEDELPLILAEGGDPRAFCGYQGAVAS
ncbi:hypothetical protein F4780DRAFT_506166 [Xylariomycetidae sp. FL0641]|nr:hypothetical protein F4780DRAFT_506166 [Xylariomycetidae sp. FL0641]